MKFKKCVEGWRTGGELGQTYGSFEIPAGMTARLRVVVGDGLGWDHVSVSVVGVPRCPTWEEMCEVKRLFFSPDEWVIQYHPSQGENINLHPYVLHLWRPQGMELPKPPPVCV